MWYLPMGAVIYTNAIWKTVMNPMSTRLMVSDVWQHDYTWSGHATCAAVALKALDIIEKEGLIHKAAERGVTFLGIMMEHLSDHHLVRGKSSFLSPINAIFVKLIH